MMFIEIKRLLNNSQLTEEELTAAAAHLLKKQFVFRDATGDKKHFRIIDKYLPEYRNAFSFFGAELVRNAEYGYIGYKPRQALGRLKLVETYCLLTLRLIYDQEKLTGLHETKDGAVIVSGERLVHEYKRNTNRDHLDNKNTFLTYLMPIKQKSLIRFGDKNPDTDIEDIFILPTIEEVIDEPYARSLIAALEKEFLDDASEEGLEEENVDEAE